MLPVWAILRASRPAGPLFPASLLPFRPPQQRRPRVHGGFLQIRAVLHPFAEAWARPATPRLPATWAYADASSFEPTPKSWPECITARICRRGPKNLSLPLSYREQPFSSALRTSQPLSGLPRLRHYHASDCLSRKRREQPPHAGDPARGGAEASRGRLVAMMESTDITMPQMRSSAHHARWHAPDLENAIPAF